MFVSKDPNNPSLAPHIASYIQSNTLSSAYYLYDQQHIISHIDTLHTSLQTYTGGYTIRYAMKALPLQAILQTMKAHDVAIDACSGYEAQRAINAGIAPDQIQITGQIQPHNMVKLVEQGVRFCACSLSQLERFGQLFRGREVGVRINPGVGSGQFPGVNVGGHRSSFGIWHSYIDQIVSLADQYNLAITTVHTHIGSGSDPYARQDVADLSLSFVEQLPSVRTINLGGGFKVARMTDEKKADIRLIMQKITDKLGVFASRTGRELHLEIEPGTFLVANSGYLVTSVDDIVDTGPEGEHFVKLTIGMSDIIRPIMYGARHPMRRESDAQTSISTIIVGHSCESSDLLTVDNHGVATHRMIPAVDRGSRVIIGGVGAYCSSMRTTHYNSYPSLPEYLLLPDHTAICIKQGESLSDITIQEKNLNQ